VGRLWRDLEHPEFVAEDREVREIEARVKMAELGIKMPKRK